MSRGIWRRALCLAPLAFLRPYGVAADPQAVIQPRSRAWPAQPPFAPLLHIQSQLVLVPVTVTDRLGRPVIGLEKASFRLFDGNREQRILSVAFEDVPMAIAIVFDASASMEQKMRKARAGVRELVRIANPEDEFLLIEFDDNVRLAQPWTSDGSRLLAPLSQTAPRGRTALLDAIAMALDQLRKSGQPRRAVVILSDGGDNRSRHTEKAIRSLVQESGALLYAAGMFSGTSPDLSAEEIDGPRLLKDLAEATGGRLFPVGNLNDLPETARQIGLELHNQYVLAFAPDQLEADGKYHRVRVKVVAPEGQSMLRAHWRTGYRAPVR